ncbi:cytosolic Fe-S cluster assembly factor NUBP2-like [Styela clava]
MDNLESVKHVIVILSGKGGVGKSTIATQLALCLTYSGKKVGILDVDLCGPSIPIMLGVADASIHQCDDGWVPVFVDKEQKLSLMSIGFLLNNKDDPVVWRGPKKNGMIKQFVQDVVWDELDYLIVDTPPGTSDEHLAVLENLRSRIDGAILVTTPQAVAIADVQRELTFCRKTKLPVLGIIENMSGYVCPHCSECSLVFSQGGGEELSIREDVPFLGRVPLDPQLTLCLENGQSFLEAFPKSSTIDAIKKISQKFIDENSIK